MKKPVKPTEAIIQESVAKRKTVLRTEVRTLKSGDLASLNNQIVRFAANNGVAADDVKFTFGYYGNENMRVRRLETETEKYERVKSDLMSRYRNKKYEWDRQQEREQYERDQAEATHNVTVTCKCNCNCR